MIVVAAALSKKMVRSVFSMIVTENGRTAGIFAELNVLRPYFRIHLCKER